MNILITGANGFIGRHLCKHLGYFHNVYGISMESEKIDGCITTITYDLTKITEESLDGIRTKIDCKIDVILNLASLLVGADNSKSPEILFNNLQLALSVIKLVNIFNIKKVINFSTIAVYPNISGTFCENSVVWTASNSDCIYGLSKFCTENLLSFYLSDKNVIHLRLAQVYGEGMRNDRIMPMMIKELKEKNQITVYGNGLRVSNFIHITKLLKIVDVFLNVETQGLFNVGDESLTYSELAKKIVVLHGDETSKINYIEFGSKSEFYLDTNKLSNFLKERE